MRLIWMLLVLLARPVFCQTPDKVTDTLRKQWDESYKLRWQVQELQEQAETGQRDEAIRTLKDMLVTYDMHPLMPSILLALGRIAEGRKHFSEAEVYYRRAMEYPVKSDDWGFEQQFALRTLAALHERQGKYRKAADLLISWHVVSDCGNGADYSEYDRLFKVLELRLHYDSKDRVYTDFWSQFLSGDYLLKINSGATLDEWATRIRRLYGPADAARLRSDMGRVETRFVRREAESNPDKNRRQMAIALFGVVRRQLDYPKEIESCSTDKLAECLVTTGGQQYNRYSGLNEFFTGNGNLWREEALISCMIGRGRGALQELMAAADAQDNQLILLAIGAIGGRAAADFLIARAANEQNSYNLRDCYYALLVTGDPRARSFVESAVPEGATDQSYPAVWALSVSVHSPD